ncbi:MAG: IS200/IS605 family element transposase accessory protein TnpB [Candidatus Helarchaeota archaeon]|nr:IS200/IS605 family element transposase accessory protein TnpB [Candidatus Helarchaeota archaeon]
MREFGAVYNQYLEHWSKSGRYSKTFLEKCQVKGNILVNTRQCCRDVTNESIKSYLAKRKTDPRASPPSPVKGLMTARLNYKEGYKILANNRVRISVRKGVRLVLEFVGSKRHMTLVELGLAEALKFGSANLKKTGKKYYLFVNVDLGKKPIFDDSNGFTFIGIDNNTTNIALSAVNMSGIVLGSLIIDFSPLAHQRFKFFKIRKRLQKVDKKSMIKKIGRKQQKITNHALHLASKLAVGWISKFEYPVVIFEDLTNIRDNINWGKKKNLKYHSWGFRKLQDFITYKALIRGYFNYFVSPHYTSQNCVLCQTKKESHKRKRLFKCSNCGHVDHRDRNASLNIALKGLIDLYSGSHKMNNGLKTVIGYVNLLSKFKKVPSVKNFPMIRKVRLLAADNVDLSTSAMLNGAIYTAQSGAKSPDNSRTLTQCLTSRGL